MSLFEAYDHEHMRAGGARSACKVPNYRWLGRLSNRFGSCLGPSVHHTKYDTRSIYQVDPRSSSVWWAHAAAAGHAMDETLASWLSPAAGPKQVSGLFDANGKSTPLKHR